MQNIKVTQSTYQAYNEVVFLITFNLKSVCFLLSRKLDNFQTELILQIVLLELAYCVLQQYIFDV